VLTRVAVFPVHAVVDSSSAAAFLSTEGLADDVRAMIRLFLQVGVAIANGQIPSIFLTLERRAI